LNCNICNSEVKKIFSAKVLKKYAVDYFKCANCGFIQTQRPFWLKESYKDSINVEDTGILERNFYFADLVSPIIKLFFNKNENYLDYAGGYGMFSRLMANRGIKVYWDDPYTENIFAKGLEYSKNKKINVITSFECFEHLDKPLKEIEKMLAISKTIIFSTLLLPCPVPPKNWHYFGFEHGQHISFYSKKK
jgi:hypothetical protein